MALAPPPPLPAPSTSSAFVAAPSLSSGKPQSKEGRVSLSTANQKFSADADFSPNPPTRFSLVAAPPQMPSLSVISSRAVVDAPAVQDQRHGEMEDKVKRQVWILQVILQYWKMYSTRYPILARMARDILAVPASTVASESAFSTGERIINDYRSRLKSETIEALICLQDWLRSQDSTRDNIAGNIAVDDRDCI